MHSIVKRGTVTWNIYHVTITRLKSSQPLFWTQYTEYIIFQILNPTHIKPYPNFSSGNTSTGHSISSNFYSPVVEIFWNWNSWFGRDFHLTRDLDFHLNCIPKNYLVPWMICRRCILECSGLDFQFHGLRLLENTGKNFKHVVVIISRIVKGVKDMVVKKWLEPEILK